MQECKSARVQEKLFARVLLALFLVAFFLCSHCVNHHFFWQVSGELRVTIALNVRRALSVTSGQSVDIGGFDERIKLAACTSWDVEQGRNIDLDLSCVGMSDQGRVMLDETVYFGDLTNSNGAMVRSLSTAWLCQNAAFARRQRVNE